MTISKGSWALGQGIVQGNNIYKFLGTFLGKLLGQGPKDVEMLSPWWFESNWPELSRSLSYIRLATTSHWSVGIKPWTRQHPRVLGPLAKELSKESSKEITSTNSLEPSLDNSLAKVQRMLRCCHLDGLKQTDQHKVDASLIYTDRHWPALTGINRH